MVVMNCVAVRALVKPMCLASDINTEQLRFQLNQLHSEAETTRGKANNARLRLMRLSEAAQKLQHQASISVRKQKEHDARELLFQKRKVVQALEKSKSRIELLDELLAKLNEAIAVKETQLVGKIASDLEAGSGDDASSPVRIVSPRHEEVEDSNENKPSTSTSTLECSDLQNQQFSTNRQNSLFIEEPEDLQGDYSLSSVPEVSSYKEFLDHLDQQLNLIEEELATFIKVSALVLDSNEKPKNSKVHQAKDLLDSVCRVRRRIASIVRTEVNT